MRISSKQNHVLELIDQGAVIRTEKFEYVVSARITIYGMRVCTQTIYGLEELHLIKLWHDGRITLTEDGVEHLTRYRRGL